MIEHHLPKPSLRGAEEHPAAGLSVNFQEHYMKHHKFHKTTIEHHKDGSHTVEHHHEDGDHKNVKSAHADHDSMQTSRLLRIRAKVRMKQA